MTMNSKKVLMTIGLSSAVAGCSAFQPSAELNIRAVDTELLAGQGDSPLSEGRAKLALGQNGLAISAFRKALREQPDSAEAHNGLGIAYDRIGRKDLAQRYFELAVAGAPDNSRFNGNLARFFESSGRPHMAQGLTPPHVAALPQPQTGASDAGPTLPGGLEQKPEIAVAMAEIETSRVEVESPTVPPLAQLDTDLVQDVLGQPQELPARAAPVARANAAQFAVYRPASPVAIRSAAIDPAALPERPVSPDAHEERQPVDIPRQPAFPAQREGLRLERVSLGEVRLVTQRSASVPARRAAADFDGFGARLASWLPGAIELEQTHVEVTPRKGPALKSAVALAALEVAVADADALPKVDSEKGTFTYAFFDDDTIVHTSLAAL